MGLLSKKIRRDQLNLGDHIYTWRLGYFYSHHGIYVDDGKVVHLTRAPGLIIFSSSDESSPSHHSGEDRVVCCSIEEFLCGGDLYLYEYGVMTALFIIKRGGNCTPFTSDPPKDVLHRASILLEKGFGDYNLFENNCEDFAIYCKTSLLRVDGPNRGISGQIQFLVAITTVVISSPLGSLPSALALVIHGVQYCSLRLMLNKDDVKIVEVENLDDLSNRRTTWMENRRTSRSSAGYYIAYTIHIFNVWSWTPTSRILLWIRFFLLFSGLEGFVSDHLRAHRINLKVGEHVAWIIWVLGCWYWRSESRIYFWTKLYCLSEVLLLFVSDQQRRWKRNVYVTANALAFWYWTPESTILLWIRFVLLFSCLKPVVSDHLRIDRINLKVGEHVAWIIWLLGCWYWRSESRLYFWTKLLCLYNVLLLFVSDQPRKLYENISVTVLVLGLWYWTPESTILLWIRLVFLNRILWDFVSNQLFNRRFNFGRFFFACFVIQSAALFMGLDYKDYVFRITKSIFL